MSGLLTKLENEINYKFRDKTFLEIALTHRSVGHSNNERLEYLGDAVLDFVIPAPGSDGRLANQPEMQTADVDATSAVFFD